MSIRVAIIGVGVMGRDHARIFAEDMLPATLQVVCDVSKTSAQDVASQYSANDIATDPHAVVHRQDVDAIVIASPDNTHAELAIEAIKLGKPVLCEKPLGATLAECRAVVDAECRLGKQLIQVGFMRRFDHTYLGMKAAYESRDIGDAILMHNFHRNVEAPPSFTGFMAITNSAPHEFDIVRYVLNTNISTITAFEPGMETGNECKPVVMVLETSNGQLVTVEVNNNARYGYDVRAELVGAVGSISLLDKQSVRLDKALSSSTAYATDWRSKFADAYRQQNKAWIHSIETGKPSLTAANAWDGYCATAIAEAGVAALQSGEKTRVELPATPQLYSQLEADA